MKRNSTPQKILKALKSAKNVLIIMDSRFDYDALGSVLAFSDALGQLKISHRCVYGYDIPPKPKDYFNTSMIEENIEIPSLDYSVYDLVVFLDTGTLEHITKTSDYRTPDNIITLNIDHHAGNQLFGTLNYVKIKASTASVLYDLFLKWGIVLTSQIANYLLAGEVTDTGLLQYNSINSTELKMIASLVEIGGGYFDFVNFLTNNESLEDMVVKGMVYSNLKTDIKKRLAYTTLSEDEVDKKGGRGYGVVPADLIKRLEGVDFVFVVKTDSRTPDSWKISLRSHDMNFDVLKIAQRLNGGGHKVAAGCSIPFSEAKTVNDVVEKIWKIAQKTN